jgi:hypothetical protein
MHPQSARALSWRDSAELFFLMFILAKVYGWMDGGSLPVGTGFAFWKGGKLVASPNVAE